MGNVVRREKNSSRYYLESRTARWHEDQAMMSRKRTVGRGDTRRGDELTSSQVGEKSDSLRGYVGTWVHRFSWSLGTAAGKPGHVAHVAQAPAQLPAAALG